MLVGWRGPYWEPRDIWLGIYWCRGWIGSTLTRKGGPTLEIYVCLIPCFPIHLIWRGRR